MENIAKDINIALPYVIKFEANFYYSNEKEILNLLGFSLFSKAVFPLELKFSENIFETPYLLIIYDNSNNTPL